MSQEFLKLDKPLNGRFAPSPTGEIHAGTIFAALTAWLISKSSGGLITLRMEDIDPSRSKQAYSDAIMHDFEQLGLTWYFGPIYQSNRSEAYQKAYSQLLKSANIYNCYCSRADIAAANAPHLGDYVIYPKTCLKLTPEELSRLNQQFISNNKLPAKRIEVPNKLFKFNDIFQDKNGLNLAKDCGDFVIKRSDGGFSYNLAVVVDDADENIDIVVRGCDLLRATPQHIYLQKLLGLNTPVYAHIPLFCDINGKRLAKRNHNATYSELLVKYRSPEGVLGHIAFLGMLQERDKPLTAFDLLSQFDLNSTINKYKKLKQIAYF